MIAKLKGFWCQLPQWLQAGLVTFASGAGVGLLDAWSDGHFSKHDIISSASAGAAALKAFYMIPNRTPPALNVPKAGGN